LLLRGRPEIGKGVLLVDFCKPMKRVGPKL